VLAQAVIGGITVLAGLAWWTVSVHFLVSMVLVWLAVLLVRAAAERDGPAVPVLPAAGRRLIGLSTVVLAAVLVAGTLVTAAGPHAGDANTPRLGLGVPPLVQLHADLMVGYLGLLVGLGFLLRAADAGAALLRRYAVLVAAVLAQGALGGVQYALGVPEGLVSLHVLGAALVTASAAALWAAQVERPPVPMTHADDRPAESAGPSTGPPTGPGGRPAAPTRPHRRPRHNSPLAEPTGGRTCARYASSRPVDPRS
jgi:cytochrome c oxidase assembly protein subunit 15